MNREVNKKGLVLITVLWVVVVLMVLVAAVGRTGRLDTRICLAGTEAVRCKWAARAGIETACAILNEDVKESDSLTELWSDNVEDFNDIELERCRFSVQVIDEASKLNINTATREQLLGLTYMTDEIVDAIIDWRDEDDTPSKGGAERGYYRNLRYGYEIRNGFFKTVRELLMVKGINEELLYGEDMNCNDQLDSNERDGDESPPSDNGDDKLDRGWVEYLTCYSYDNNTDSAGNSRVNINEGDENQLASSLGIRSSQAKWIVENRDNDGYESIGDLINQNSPKRAQQSSGNDSENAEPLDLETFANIADKITITGDSQIPGRVNINTASKTVLTALLGDNSSSEQIADEIINYRDGLLGGMVSIAEVLSVGSMKTETFKNIANYITTRSDVFTIDSFGVAQTGRRSTATVRTEVVVDRSSTPHEILYWYEGASN